MLSVTAIEATTLELIKSLQGKPYLNGFYLVGGTALALSLGHRKSIDIDLFSNFDFDAAKLLEQIHKDVDLADWPVLIENPKLKWVEVKKRIEKAVMEYVGRT